MPGVAASGETDQYAAVRKIMKSIGCEVEDADSETFSGISVIPGPAVVVKPSFAVCPAEYKEKFPSPSSIKISKSSSLVVNGADVVIESLTLDGALVINAEEGAKGVIRDLVVKNKGWVKVADESNDSEIIRMRGYRLEKIETQTITLKKDGSIDGLSPKVETQEVPTTETSTPVEPKETPARTDQGLQTLSVPPTPKSSASLSDDEVVDQECGCIIL